MTDRRGFLTVLALVFGWKIRRPHRPEFGTSATFALKMAEEPVRILAMGRKVRWMTDLKQVPTVGHIIGIRQRFRTTALRETGYHVDFGRTRLWVNGDSLREVQQ